MKYKHLLKPESKIYTEPFLWCEAQFGRATNRKNMMGGIYENDRWRYNYGTFEFVSEEDLTLFLLKWT